VLAGSGQLGGPNGGGKAAADLASDRFARYAVVGELALDGSTRPVKGALSMAMAAAAQPGVEGLVLPRENAREAAVVEGVGDHGCEYMTGGYAVILGRTGRNFAAGMSGGIAYVLDEEGHFANHVNMEMVELEDMSDPEDQQRVRQLIEHHVEYTGSARGQSVLDNWDQAIEKFVKVMPIDYKRALEELRREEQVAAPLEEVSHG